MLSERLRPIGWIAATISVLRRDAVMPFLSGAVDQSLISVTSLTLTLIAARALGPSSLGVIALGFSAYMLASSIVRSLVSEPLMTSGRVRADSAEAVTAAVCLGIAASLLASVIGILAPGTGAARGLLLFSPWMVFAVPNLLLRGLLYERGHRKRSIAASVLWLVLFLTWCGVMRRDLTPGLLVCGWGAGATASTLFMLVALRSQLVWVGPSRAWVWMLDQARQFGAWLAAETIFSNIISYLGLIAVAWAAADAAVGNIRAVQSLLSPLSLLAAAAYLPGLPAIADAVARADAAGARKIAFTITVGIGAITLIYVLVCALWSQRLIGLFGEGFADADVLVVPIGLSQFLLSLTVGPQLLLRANRRGVALLSVFSVSAVLGAALSGGLAIDYGAQGAAWGLAIAAGMNAALTVTFLLATRTGPRRQT